MGAISAAAPRSAWATCPGEHCVRMRPQDQVLLVSTRVLGCSINPSRFAQGMRALRCVPAAEAARHQWLPMPLDQAVARVQADMPTVIFVHGNRVEPNEVRSRGLWVYDRLVRAACDERPFRFLIFSWPSDEVRGAVRDARLKAGRTRPAALQMAWLVNQMAPDAPLGMLGYSFGCRIINGASHLLAGGSLSGAVLPDRGALPKRPIKAVYLASAIDADWLGPGRYEGRALNQIDDLLVSTNRLDPAMRLYGWINPNKRPPALGYSGPTCLSREQARRVRLTNVTKVVGRSHDMCDYMMVRSLMRSSWRRLTHADAAPAAAVASTRDPAGALEAGGRRE